MSEVIPARTCSLPRAFLHQFLETFRKEDMKGFREESLEDLWEESLNIRKEIPEEFQDKFMLNSGRNPWKTSGKSLLKTSEWNPCMISENKALGKIFPEIILGWVHGRILRKKNLKKIGSSPGKSWKISRKSLRRMFRRILKGTSGRIPGEMHEEVLEDPLEEFCKKSQERTSGKFTRGIPVRS